MAQKSEAIPYDQRIARMLVRPLARLGVTPNQMTTVTLLLALGATWMFAQGDPVLANWAAGLFVLARFLDHFDGELARQTGRSSQFGYYYDYIAGAISYIALFMALGLGFYGGHLGGWALMLGGVAAASALITLPINLGIDRSRGLAEGDAVGYPGLAGFELEDGMYLLAPVTWLGWLEAFFILSCLGSAVYGLWCVWSLIQARSARRRASAAP